MMYEVIRDTLMLMMLCIVFIGWAVTFLVVIGCVVWSGRKLLALLRTRPNLPRWCVPVIAVIASLWIICISAFAGMVWWDSYIALCAKL